MTLNEKEAGVGPFLKNRKNFALIPGFRIAKQKYVLKLLITF